MSARQPSTSGKSDRKYVIHDAYAPVSLLFGDGCAMFLIATKNPPLVRGASQALPPDSHPKVTPLRIVVSQCVSNFDFRYQPLLQAFQLERPAQRADPKSSGQDDRNPKAFHRKSI